MKSRIKALHAHSSFRQFLKFLVVGVINTMFGYSVFSTCIYLGFHYAFATVIMTVLGILFNFMTIGTIVFKNTNKGLILHFFIVYAILCAVGTAFIGSINLLIHNLYISGAINALVMPPFAFFLNKRFVFRQTDEALLS